MITWTIYDGTEGTAPARNDGVFVIFKGETGPEKSVFTFDRDDRDNGAPLLCTEEGLCFPLDIGDRWLPVSAIPPEHMAVLARLVDAARTTCRMLGDLPGGLTGVPGLVALEALSNALDDLNALEQEQRA